MRSGVSRVVYASLAAFGLSLVLSGSAQAQSALPTGEQSVASAAMHLDYDAAVANIAPNARTGASFLRQVQAVQVNDNEDQGIAVGVLGMLTWPSINVIDESDDHIKSRTGWGVGGWIGGNRNGRVGFVGEFIYGVRKATSQEEGEGDFDVDFEIFQIAAPFHINFGSRSRNGVGGYIVVGPSFTFNLGQKGNGVDFPSAEEFGGVDIGIIGGAGIEFYRVAIEGRGNWGLKEISDEGDFTKIKTTTFELLFKFAFN